MGRHGLFLLGALFLANSAEAAFKCVDGEGNITFSQQPCPTTETSAEIKVQVNTGDGGGAGMGGTPTCELAGLYAEDAAGRMRAGDDFSTEMGRYGGSHGANSSMVTLVNYIHSFAKTDASPGRIASLARAKCQTGGLGPVAFEHLPVSEYYVFDPQGNGWVRKGMSPTRAAAAPARTGAGSQPATPPAPAESSENRQQECERTISGLEGQLSQIGAGVDKAKLREQLSRACK